MKMKLRLAAVLVLGSLVGLGSTVQAQENKGGTSHPKTSARAGAQVGAQNRLKVLTEKLSLNEDQQAKVKAIMQQTAKEIKEVRAKPEFTSLSRQEKVAQQKKVRDEANAKVKALLTEDQKTKWDALQQQAQKRNARRR